MAIELAQKIEDNQRMHLEFTLPVFASAPAMAPAPQMAAVFFATHTQDPNEQLIDRLTANLVQLLKPLIQAVRNNQQSQRPKFELHFNQSQQPPYQRQQNHGPLVCYCCGLTGHFLETATIFHCLLQLLKTMTIKTTESSTTMSPIKDPIMPTSISLERIP
ncbi:hypothetical protein G9A89_005587 [Geosiphon pyriformis]|nr:hypothetical protein G9A89_005587 [Geosiphon pyriformis]